MGRSQSRTRRSKRHDRSRSHRRRRDRSASQDERRPAQGRVPVEIPKEEAAQGLRNINWRSTSVLPDRGPPSPIPPASSIEAPRPADMSDDFGAATIGEIHAQNRVMITLIRRTLALVEAIADGTCRTLAMAPASRVPVTPADHGQGSSSAPRPIATEEHAQDYEWPVCSCGNWRAEGKDMCRACSNQKWHAEHGPRPLIR
jgi:hypothetical protein